MKNFTRVMKPIKNTKGNSRTENSKLHKQQKQIMEKKLEKLKKIHVQFRDKTVFLFGKESRRKEIMVRSNSGKRGREGSP